MIKNAPISISDGLFAAVKVGTANAMSVVTSPFHTAQVILGMKPDENVQEMIRAEVDRRKVKHSSSGY